MPGMKRAVKATLRHMSSTDDVPKHGLCTQGPGSWYSYNHAVAKDKETPHTNSPLDFVREALEPIFKRLSEALLEWCSGGMTQNSSESLQSVIWDQVQKNKHASLHSVHRAVAEASSTKA